MNEAQVIAQVRTGRTDAFGEIIEHYQAPIVRYLLRLTGSHEVAEDLAQDTFLSAYRGILNSPWPYKLPLLTTQSRRLSRNPHIGWDAPKEGTNLNENEWSN